MMIVKRLVLLVNYFTFSSDADGCELSSLVSRNEAWLPWIFVVLAFFLRWGWGGGLSYILGFFPRISIYRFQQLDVLTQGKEFTVLMLKYHRGNTSANLNQGCQFCKRDCKCLLKCRVLFKSNAIKNYKKPRSKIYMSHMYMHQCATFMDVSCVVVSEQYKFPVSC